MGASPVGEPLQPLAPRAPDNRRFPTVSTVPTHRPPGYQRAGANPIMVHGRGISILRPVARELEKVRGWEPLYAFSIWALPIPDAWL